jgi:hypothetical protein
MRLRYGTSYSYYSCTVIEMVLVFTNINKASLASSIKFNIFT